MWGGQSYKLLMSNFLRILHNKIIKIGQFWQLFKNLKGGQILWDTVYSILLGVLFIGIMANVLCLWLKRDAAANSRCAMPLPIRGSAPPPHREPSRLGHETPPRSVQSYLQGWRKWPAHDTHTNTQTDGPRYSVCSSRPLSLQCGLKCVIITGLFSLIRNEIIAF